MRIAADEPVGTKAKHFSNSGRVPTLDGIRGVAAVCVLISHGVNQNLLPGTMTAELGTTGVDLFFVLSGFLMVRLYALRPFRFRDVAVYASHRIGRVVPLYYAVVIVSFVLYSPVSILKFFPIDSWHVLARHMTFLIGVETLWTIPIEIRFYAVFIAVWFIASQISLVAAVALSLAMSLVGLLLARSLQTTGISFFYYQSIFLTGSFLAVLWRQYGLEIAGFARTGTAGVVGWVTLFGFLLFGLLGSSKIAIPYSALWDPLRASVFFVAAVLGLGPLRLLESRLLTGLGSISYGVYLFHAPVLLTIKALLPPTDSWQGLLDFGLVCLATGILAILSFRYFETPMRRVLAVDYPSHP